MTHHDDGHTYYPPDYGMSGPRRGGYRVHSDDVWEDARRDYLERGDSADTVCARYGLAKSTFRQRSREGEWRRSDHPDMPPLPQDDEQVPVRSHAVLAAEAFRRVDQAIALGRAREAASWMRLHERLVALSPQEAQHPQENYLPQATPTPRETRSAVEVRSCDVVQPPIDGTRNEAALSRIMDVLVPFAAAAERHDIDDMVGVKTEIARLQAELHDLSQALEDEFPPVTTDHSHYSHPVFSETTSSAAEPAPDPLAQSDAGPETEPGLELDRVNLLRYRKNRLSQGMGTADLDLALADLDRRLGLPGTDLTGVSP